MLPPELPSNQQHLLAGWDALPPAARDAFARQLADIDFDTLAQLYARRDDPAPLPAPQSLAPVPVSPPVASAGEVAAGGRALREGHVAVLLVAGGQGSRLGFDKPKGMFAAGPVSGASLFQIHAEKVLALSRRYGRAVPFLVMTSPATHADTVAFFAANQNFGLPPADVFFFEQGTMPALDLATGRVLLEGPGRVFLSPNGHGGTLTALAGSGLLADLERRGAKHVFYFQVDNPLVKVADAGFLGQHIAARSEVSSKVVFKEQPGEKVGVLASVNGKCGIVEYSDMPPEMAAERDTDGTLRYRAGNTAIHLFDVDFLRRVTGRGGLAYHVARKKVPHFDPLTRQTVTPADVNALKFELFVFDALPLADRWLVVEAVREEEFAPIKNATGVDSPDTSRRLMVRLHATWLETAGVTVPRTADGDPLYAVEVSPLFALDAEECRAKVPNGNADGPVYLKPA